MGRGQQAAQAIQAGETAGKLTRESDVQQRSLLGFLRSEQALLRLDDAHFAALLGIEEPEWRALSGTGTAATRWPATVLARVLLRFPDAHPLASEEVRRQTPPGDGWRWWHAAAGEAA